MTGVPPSRRPVDAGVSLAETLVVTTLLGLVGTLVATTVVLCLRLVDGTGDRLDNLNAGEVAMRAVSKVLRTAVLPEQLDEGQCTNCAATAVTTATGTRVTFYANLAGGVGPDRVTLEVVPDDDRDVGAVLVTTTQRPQVGADGTYSFCDPAVDGCEVQRREVARGLTWPQQVFTYYDFLGEAIPGPTVSGVGLSAIASVDVSVSTGAGSRYAAGHVVQRVRLPNAEINVVVEDP